MRLDVVAESLQEPDERELPAREASAVVEIDDARRPRPRRTGLRRVRAPIDIDVARGGRVPREALGTPPARPRAREVARPRERPIEAVGQPRRVSGRHEERRREVAESLCETAHVARDHRPTAGERLEDDEPEAFELERRDDADVGGAIEVGQRLLADSPEKANLTCDTEIRGPLLEPLSLGAVAADEDEEPVTTLCFEAGAGLEQGPHSHPRNESAHADDDVARPGDSEPCTCSPPFAGRKVLEIDAGRDDIDVPRTDAVTLDEDPLERERVDDQPCCAAVDGALDRPLHEHADHPVSGCAALVRPRPVEMGDEGVPAKPAGEQRQGGVQREMCLHDVGRARIVRGRAAELAQAREQRVGRATGRAHAVERPRRRPEDDRADVEHRPQRPVKLADEA